MLDDAPIKIDRGIPNVVWLTLNRPKKLNALTISMWELLGDQLEALSADEDIRCIVIRGEGERAFSVGADIGEFAQTRANKAQAVAYGEIAHRTMRAMWNCPHPIVAQIQGLCVGGGLELASLADIRLCGAGSRFGAPVKNLGLVMSHIELQAVSRLIGAANTLSFLLEGQIVDAEEAYRLGLVTRVIADEQLDHETRATVERVASGAPLVARWHKKFIRDITFNPDLTREQREEAFDCFDTQDFKIGAQAFLAKSAPQFIGK